MRVTYLNVWLIFFVCRQVIGTELDAALKFFLSSGNSRSGLNNDKDPVKNLYDLYKREFKKNTKSLDDDKPRLASFNETLNAIADQYRQGDKTFFLELNEFADWTTGELDQLRGVHVPDDERTPIDTKSDDRPARWEGKVFMSKAESSTPSTSYDFTSRVVSGTNVPVIQPVKNQGSCGSCYAFAFVTLLEFQFAVQLKSARNLSEQQIVDCNTIDKGCNGGYFTNTFQYLKNNQWQIDGGSVYPYKTKATSCAFKGTNGGGGVKFGSLLYKKVTVNDASAMQKALVDYGPLWVSLFAGNSSTTTYNEIFRQIQSYKSGIMQFTGCPTSLSSTNHAVVIVGYGIDAATNTAFWKVRNSWGVNWGEKGYFRIKRGVNMCGIESGAFYIAKPA